MDLQFDFRCLQYFSYLHSGLKRLHSWNTVSDKKKKHLAFNSWTYCYFRQHTVLSRSADPNGSPHQMVGSADILLSVWWIISLQLLLPLLATLTPSPLTLCHDIPAIFHVICLVCSVRGSWWSSDFFCHIFGGFFFFVFGHWWSKKKDRLCVFTNTGFLMLAKQL